jgi:hypothetical protein
MLRAEFGIEYPISPLKADFGFSVFTLSRMPYYSHR